MTVTREKKYNQASSPHHNTPVSQWKFFVFFRSVCLWPVMKWIAQNAILGINGPLKPFYTVLLYRLYLWAPLLLWPLSSAGTIRSTMYRMLPDKTTVFTALHVARANVAMCSGDFITCLQEGTRKTQSKKKTTTKMWNEAKEMKWKQLLEKKTGEQAHTHTRAQHTKTRTRHTAKMMTESISRFKILVQVIGARTNALSLGIHSF